MAALRHLFVRVRCCAHQTTIPARLCLIVISNYSSAINIDQFVVILRTFNLICEHNQLNCLPLLTFGGKSLGSFLISINLFTLLSTTTTNIHISKFRVRNLESAYLFTCNYFWKLISIPTINGVFLPPSL